MTSLLPPASSPLERALEAAVAARFDELPTPIGTVWDVEMCLEALLPYLAWALSVDDWSEDWPGRQKRSVIAAAIAVHRSKGTVGAVHKALAALELDLIRIIEWWETEGSGEPYTFNVEVATTSRGVSPKEWENIRRAIDRAKNLRSHLGSLKVYLQASGKSPIVAFAPTVGEYISVYPWESKDIVQKFSDPYVALGTHTWSIMTVGPFNV
ncbi:phage tail protein I [Pararhodospirillum photometricum]|uniref:phage tail protein I n=1 Tax=Pararhodospirillum photometricum TaxID=1084 RepID=UPI0009DA1FEF|nr:phage tail protein I [Pararhodospirillum photometricum]